MFKYGNVEALREDIMKSSTGLKSLAVAIIILLVLVGCLINLRINHISYYDPFMDFNFRFNFGPDGGVELDTFKFKLSGTLRGYRATGFLLPHWARQIVFDMMHDMDIMNYPDSLNSTSENINNVENFTLMVRIENEEKVIKWDVQLKMSKEDLEEMTDEQRAFLELAEQIKEFVLDSPAFDLLTYGDDTYL